MISSISYGKWLYIHSFVESDLTEIYTPRLSIGLKLRQPRNMTSCTNIHDNVRLKFT